MSEGGSSAEAGDEAAADEESLRGFVEAGRRLIADSGELISLETRLAVEAGLRMFGAAVAGAILAAASWLCLMAAAYVVAVRAGWPAEWVLVMLAAANALICLILAAWVRRLCRYLTFPGTRRLLLGNGSDAHAAE